MLPLDNAWRIKPCGGAIPPRLIQDFEVPDHLIVAKVSSVRIISPPDRKVDLPIDGSYAGMVAAMSSANGCATAPQWQARSVAPATT